MVNVVADDENGHPTFRQFAEIMSRHASLLRTVVRDLTRLRGLDEDLERELIRLRDSTVIVDYRDQILAALRIPNSIRRALRCTVADHTLDMALKKAAFDAAVRGSRYHESVADDGTPQFSLRSRRPREGTVGRALESTAQAFEVANAIARSAAHAIPAAGAYGEVKDAVEAAVGSLLPWVAVWQRSGSG